MQVTITIRFDLDQFFSTFWFDPLNLLGTSQGPKSPITVLAHYSVAMDFGPKTKFQKLIHCAKNMRAKRLILVYHIPLTKGYLWTEWWFWESRGVANRGLKPCKFEFDPLDNGRTVGLRGKHPMVALWPMARQEFWDHQLRPIPHSLDIMA